jgi:twinkle protein
MNFNWDKYGIDISKAVGGKMICPKCSHTRKHSRDKCLSVDIVEGLFNCHNCDFKGSVKEFKPQKTYIRPLPRLEKVGKKTIEFFEGRGISNDTLLRFNVTEAKEWMPQFENEVACICFNYYRGEELTNIKFRGPKKSFKMAKDAELIFYNINSIAEEQECVIVEGEMDCLTLHECGIYNGVSVPNGASKGSQKLEYLDNCWQFFENKSKVVLAVDNDEAGISLRDELARRLGKEKCFTVFYPEGCKDVNEVLMTYGKETVVKVISEAKEIPLEGIISMDQMFPVIQSWYEHGYPKGARARIENFDNYLTFVPGQLTMITGIPGHGKDEFANLIMSNLGKYEDWIWGMCSFEETPHQTTTKLMEKYIGKSFDFRQDKANRISQTEYERGLIFVDDHFKFMDTENIETDLVSVLSLAEKMVRRFGIKGFCINPWNWLEHQRDSFMSETEYVSVALSKIIQFAKRFQVHIFLMAHPTKVQKTDKKKYDVPTLYSISGSANFFNKTHNGITVYRDVETVDIHVQKVKQSWLGKVGLCQFTYNTLTRQYTALTDWTPKLVPVNNLF